MTLNKVGPVALAAAAGLLAIAAGMYLFGGRGVGSPDATPSSAPSATESSVDSSSPSVTAGCADTETRATGLGGTLLEIDWCVARSAGFNRLIPFTMEGPAAWIDQDFGDIDALWLAPAGGGRIAWVLHPEQSVDELAAEIAGRDGYAVTAETPTDIGGAPGVTFDVALGEGASSGSVEPLVITSGMNWMLTADSGARVWLVDLDGETLMVITGAGLADQVSDALGTLVWGD